MYTATNECLLRVPATLPRDATERQLVPVLVRLALQALQQCTLVEQIFDMRESLPCACCQLEELVAQCQRLQTMSPQGAGVASGRSVRGAGTQHQTGQTPPGTAGNYRIRTGS